MSHSSGDRDRTIGTRWPRTRHLGCLRRDPTGPTLRDFRHVEIRVISTNLATGSGRSCKLALRSPLATVGMRRPHGAMRPLVPAKVRVRWRKHRRRDFIRRRDLTRADPCTPAQRWCLCIDGVETQGRSFRERQPRVPAPRAVTRRPHQLAHTAGGSRSSSSSLRQHEIRT